MKEISFTPLMATVLTRLVDADGEISKTNLLAGGLNAFSVKTSIGRLRTLHGLKIKCFVGLDSSVEHPPELRNLRSRVSFRLGKKSRKRAQAILKNKA